MKWYKLLTDNSLFYAEGIFSEPLKNRLLRELPENEAKAQEFEEVTADWVRDNQYYLVSGADFTGSTGERNVFYDHNGNEWHN